MKAKGHEIMNEIKRKTDLQSNMLQPNRQKLGERFFDFAVKSAQFVASLPNDMISRELGRQFLKASSSIGANWEEAIGGLTDADFTHSATISRKEARESYYWLRLLAALGKGDSAKRNYLLQESSELVLILTSIVKKLQTRKKSQIGKLLLLLSFIPHPLSFILPVSAFAEIRPPAVAGKFYPSDPEELKKAVDEYLAKAPPPQKLPGRVLCLLVPHAGYEFSAPVAAAGYRAVTGPYETVVILGSAHTMQVKGAAVCPSGSFQTPLGKIDIDEKLAKELIAASSLFENLPQAHEREHSIEVQLPFLIRKLKTPFKILPIVMNTDDPDTAIKAGDILGNILKRKKTLIVVSSDLSHYPEKNLASVVDRTTLEALKTADPEYFWLANRILMNRREKNLECTYCGEAGLIAGLTAARVLGADKGFLIKYSNSGESPLANPENAVGYASMAFARSGKPAPAEILLTPAQKKLLLSAARKAVADKLDGKTEPSRLFPDPVLNLPAAVFVTLTESGILRGCIGTTEPRAGLKEAVEYSARTAAFEDHRFQPVTKDELPKIHVEISILSRMNKIPGHEGIIPKKHGVVLSRGARSGLFLPQVWEQIPSKEDFLSEICSQKAGLPRDCWKDPETNIFIFTVNSFEEPGKGG